VWSELIESPRRRTEMVQPVTGSRYRECSYPNSALACRSIVTSQAIASSGLLPCRGQTGATQR
jgi:hypothetical protein